MAGRTICKSSVSYANVTIPAHHCSIFTGQMLLLKSKTNSVKAMTANMDTSSLTRKVKFNVSHKKC